MKIMYIKRTAYALFLTSCILMIGCKDQSENSASPKTGKKSTAVVLRDGFTGKTAVEEGKKAKEKLRNIAADRDKQLEQFD
jgi:hypothetical protein